MARYGSDKPDLRFGLELDRADRVLQGHQLRRLQGTLRRCRGHARRRLAAPPRFDAWQEWAKQRGAKGLAYVTVKEDGELAGPVAKNLTDAERAGLADAVGAKPGDCIFFAAGAQDPSRALLGAARVEIGHRTGLIDPRRLGFLLGRGRADVRAGRGRRGLRRRGGRRAASGPPSTTRSPRPSPSHGHASTQDPDPRCPTPTTSSATATKSAAARSVSTSVTCRSASSS